MNNQPLDYIILLIPFLTGLSHVNNQPLDYVIKTLDTLGFTHDAAASKEIQAVCSLSWLKANVNVYRRKSSHPLQVEQL